MLVVLGRTETEKAESISRDLSPMAKELLHDTEQLRDGKWLWIRLQALGDTDDVVKLLAAKRKPKSTQR